MRAPLTTANSSTGSDGRATVAGVVSVVSTGAVVGAVVVGGATDVVDAGDVVVAAGDVVVAAGDGIGVSITVVVGSDAVEALVPQAASVPKIATAQSVRRRDDAAMRAGEGERRCVAVNSPLVWFGSAGGR
jgi:hypothetical protein